MPLEEPDFRESGNHTCFYISLDSHEKTNPDSFFYFVKDKFPEQSQPAEKQLTRRGYPALEARPGRRLRKMIPRQDKADPDNDANDEAGDETKTGGVTDGTLTQIKNSGRLIFVHENEFAPLSAGHN